MVCGKILNTGWARLKRLCSCLKKKKNVCVICPKAFNLDIYWHFHFIYYTKGQTDQ